MNKKIITIAEIVFALVFVILLAVFMATINSKGNQANNQLVDTLDSTTGTSLTKYETMETVKGSVVQNAVENYTTLSSENKITVAVQTKEDGDGHWTLYGYDKKGDTHPSYVATSTDTWYINQSSDFGVKVIRNVNDVIVGVAFQQGVKSADMDYDTIQSFMISDTQNVSKLGAGSSRI